MRISSLEVCNAEIEINLGSIILIICADLLQITIDLSSAVDTKKFLSGETHTDFILPLCIFYL
jgi:hypothetical protein